MHRHLLHNEQICDTTERLLLPGQVGFLNGWGVFSTVRVRDGVLFAFDRHYLRMKMDAQRLHVPFEYTREELEALMLSLVKANHAENATLKACRCAESRRTV